MTEQSEPESGATPVEEPAPFAPPEAPVAAEPAEPATDVVTPEPEPVPEPVAAPEPTPTVSAADASFSRPAGSAAPPPPSPLSAQAYEDRPEVLVGAAFAGGILAALILKRLGK